MYRIVRKEMMVRRPKWVESFITLNQPFTMIRHTKRDARKLLHQVRRKLHDSGVLNASHGSTIRYDGDDEFSIVSRNGNCQMTYMISKIS